MRTKIVELAQSCLGINEKNGSHKKIIDTYNNHTPLARGYHMTYTDAWCATFISYLAIETNLTDIIPTECGCERMIDLFKKLGEWVENDAYIPAPGDIIFYDWQDSGKGDNAGWGDHVGIVEKCDGKNITVIEGNKNDAVERRIITVDARYIRGFGVPKYKKLNINMKGQIIMVQLVEIHPGDKGPEVMSMQALLNLRGFNCGKADGDYGPKTKSALDKYQKTYGLTPYDSICGVKTWTKLIMG